MKITRENYEQYFIDYLDGNLTGQEIIMLENFLIMNPQLCVELEGLEKVILSPDRDEHMEKSLLKLPDVTLPVSDDNFEDFSIAASEGDLSENMIREFNNYLELHTEKLNDYSILNQLHLIPDKKIRFQNKADLKKLAPFHWKPIIYTTVSIAATFVLLFIIFKQDNGIHYIRDEKITLNSPVITEKILVAEPELNDTIQKIRIPELQKSVKIEKPVLKEKEPEIQLTEISQNQSDKIEKPDISDIIIPVEIDLELAEKTKITFPTNDSNLIKNESVPVSSSGEYLSLKEFARKQLNEKVLDKKDDNLSKPTAWDAAVAGVKGINRLTGSNMRLEKRKNKDGKINSISFESGLLSFVKTVNSTDNAN